MNEYTISYLRFLISGNRIESNTEIMLSILKKLGKLLSHRDTYSEKHMENELLLLATEFIDGIAKEKNQ